MWLQSFSCLYTVVHFVWIRTRTYRHTHFYIRVKWQQTRVSLDSSSWYKYYAEQSTRIFLFRCVACNSKWNGLYFAIDPRMNSLVSFGSSIVLFLYVSLFLSLTLSFRYLCRSLQAYFRFGFQRYSVTSTAIYFHLGDRNSSVCRCSIEIKLN